MRPVSPPAYCLAVSEENVKAVHAVYGEFNRRNLRAMLQHFDPDAEWERVAPDPDVYRGLDDITKRLRERPENLRMEPRRWFEAGGDPCGRDRRDVEEGPSVAPESPRDFVHVWKVKAGKAAWVFEITGEPSQD